MIYRNGVGGVSSHRAACGTLLGTAQPWLRARCDMAVSVPNRARRAAVLTYCKPKQSVMSGELIVVVRDKRVDPAMPQNLGQELTDRFKSLSLSTEVRSAPNYIKVSTTRLARQRNHFVQFSHL